MPAVLKFQTLATRLRLRLEDARLYILSKGSRRSQHRWALDALMFK